MSTKENGCLSKSLIQGLRYLTLSLRMMSFSLSELEKLKFVLSPTYLTDSTRHRVWRLIFPNLELFIPQVLLKEKLAVLLLFQVFRALLPFKITSAFPSSKAGQKEVISFLSLKKCILRSLLGRTNSSTNLEDWL